MEYYPQKNYWMQKNINLKSYKIMWQLLEWKPDKWEPWENCLKEGPKGRSQKE